MFLRTRCANAYMSACARARVTIACVGGGDRSSALRALTKTCLSCCAQIEKILVELGDGQITFEVFKEVMTASDSDAKETRISIEQPPAAVLTATAAKYAADTEAITS